MKAPMTICHDGIILTACVQHIKKHRVLWEPRIRTALNAVQFGRVMIGDDAASTSEKKKKCEHRTYVHESKYNQFNRNSKEKRSNYDRFFSVGKKKPQQTNKENNITKSSILAPPPTGRFGEPAAPLLIREMDTARIVVTGCPTH